MKYHTSLCIVFSFSLAIAGVVASAFGQTMSATGGSAPAANISAAPAAVAAEPLELRIFKLKYAQAEVLAQQVGNLFAIAVTPDVRTNCLVIRTDKKMLDEIEKLVQQLDQEAPAQPKPHNLSSRRRQPLALAATPDSAVVEAPDSQSARLAALGPAALVALRVSAAEGAAPDLAEALLARQVAVGKAAAHSAADSPVRPVVADPAAVDFPRVVGPALPAAWKPPTMHCAKPMLPQSGPMRK